MIRRQTKGGYLEALLRSPKTIFSMEDIALLWGAPITTASRMRLSYYIRSGKLVRAYRGLYAKDKNYDRFELATRINTPAYISFETVLTRAGVNFQYYNSIFVASYKSKEMLVDNQKIIFIRMKDYVLSNTVGIEHQNGVAIATGERAFLDRVYVSKDYHFDNLSKLNWKKVFEILPIYQNKRMERKVKEYFESYQKDEIS